MIKEFFDPLYLVNYIVAVGNLDAFKNRIKKYAFDWDNLGNAAGYFKAIDITYPSGRCCKICCIWMKKNSIQSLYHESIHAVFWVLKDHDVKDEEAFNYYLEYLIREIRKKIKKWEFK